MTPTRLGWGLAAVAPMALAAGSTWAAGLVPDSYNMLNGNTGSYQYWDESYSGSGCVTCDGAALSGGRGDLTDGIIASDNWFVVEAPQGNGPYVGWTIDPTITFHWNSPVTVNSVTLHLDDANGEGGVSAPSSAVINGVTHVIADPAGSAPFSFFTSGVSFTGTDLAITLNRSNVWVFLSEVEFNAPVPEPESWASMLLGLGLLAATARAAQAAKRRATSAPSPG